MKTNQLITLGVLIGTCSFAAAQDTPPPARPQRQMPPGMLEKFDTDGDGKLSESEMGAMQAEMKAKRAEMMKKYDKDGDGKLSPDERKAQIADMQAKHKALVAKYDANGNGKLDPEEFKAAREAGEEIPIMGRRPGGEGGPGGQGRKGGQRPGGPGTPDAPGGDAPAPAPEAAPE